MKGCEADIVFAQRYAEWQRRYRFEGAASAYPYAWRLPERARALGTVELARAQLALARTLFCLGRYAAARAALPEVVALSMDEQAQALGLAGRCAVMLGEAPLPAHMAIDNASARVETAHLELLADRPGALLAALPAYSQAARDIPEVHAWCEVHTTWARARSGRGLDLATALRAIARLHRHTPAEAAHAEAVLAEAAFHQAPHWSLVWLDEALDACARYAQHHVEVRLLGLKSRALGAAGALREADRFRALANSLRRRQGMVRDGAEG